MKVIIYLKSGSIAHLLKGNGVNIIGYKDEKDVPKSSHQIETIEVELQGSQATVKEWEYLGNTLYVQYNSSLQFYNLRCTKK